MLGSKLNKKHLVTGFKKAKKIIGHAYNSTENCLGNIDDGV